LFYAVHGGLLYKQDQRATIRAAILEQADNGTIIILRNANIPTN